MTTTSSATEIHNDWQAEKANGCDAAADEERGSTERSWNADELDLARGDAPADSHARESGADENNEGKHADAVVLSRAARAIKI